MNQRTSSNARLLADMLQNEFEVEDRDLTPLDDVFAEQFPPLLTFIADKQFMRYGSMELSPIQEQLLRHFEQILRPETYIEMVRYWGPEYAPVRFVNNLACAWGKGSGKDMSIQLGFSRIANILLSMKWPHTYYKLPDHTIIHMMNVAASSKQAHGVFFKPLRNLITKAPWYADKFESGEPPGPQAGEIRFIKQIELISGHSDPETLEGKNLIAAVADEISAFPLADTIKSSKGSSGTAEALVQMLQSSASTRFPEFYKMVQISYPRARGDAILKALDEAKKDEQEQGDHSRYYSSGPHSTWTVRPDLATIEKITIPGVDNPIPNIPSIVSDYRKNLSFAKAKYECDPDAAINRFFGDDIAIFASFDQKRLVDPISFIYRLGKDEDEEGTVDQWQCDFAFSPDFLPMPGAIYSIHGDMAVTGDRAGVVLSHVRDYKSVQDHEGRFERRPVVSVDFVGSWESDASAINPENNKALPREIQIRWFRKLVMALLERGFQIGHVSMDGFQSVDSLQILASRGIEAVKISLDRNPEGYQTLKDVMYEGRLDGYYHELLIHEISSINRYPNGKIDHLPGGSKDIADALAGSVLGAVTIGGEEEDPNEPSGLIVALPTPGFSQFEGWAGKATGAAAFGVFGQQGVTDPWGD